MKLLVPPTDKSPDPLPLIVVMVIATDDETDAMHYALACKARRFMIEIMALSLKKPVRFISFIDSIILFCS